MPAAVSQEAPSDDPEGRDTKGPREKKGHSRILTICIHLHWHPSARWAEDVVRPDSIAGLEGVVAGGAVANAVMSGHDRRKNPPARSSRP